MAPGLQSPIESCLHQSICDHWPPLHVLKKLNMVPDKRKAGFVHQSTFCSWIGGFICIFKTCQTSYKVCLTSLSVLILYKVLLRWALLIGTVFYSQVLLGVFFFFCLSVCLFVFLFLSPQCRRSFSFRKTYHAVSFKL